MRTLLERQMDSLQVEESNPPAGDFDMEAIEARVGSRGRREPAPRSSGAATRPLDSLLEVPSDELPLAEGFGEEDFAGNEENRDA